MRVSNSLKRKRKWIGWKTALLVLVCLTVGGGRTAQAQGRRIRAAHILWFGLDLDMGYGTELHGDGKEWLPLWRAKAGASLFTPYWIVGLAGAAQLVGLEADFEDVAWGVQLEAIHIQSGLSGYAGAHVYGDKTVGAVVGLGWSVFYVESELLPERRSRVFFKLRIPLSTAAFVWWARRQAN
jgi:hypothetical protein